MLIAGHVLQISLSSEEAVTPSVTPEQYADKMFGNCMIFPFQELDSAQLARIRDKQDNIKEAYLRSTTELAKQWQRSGDIVISYTMMWAEAVRT